MKKVPLIAAGIVLSLIAIILIVPGMINWNEYKSEISALAKSVTGRQLVIAGNIRLTVLPSPTLIANDVSLSNIDGATAQYIVRLDKLEIHAALVPLLGGSIRVKTVNLVRPVIELEILEDGRKNWQFSPNSETGNADKPDQPRASGDISPSDGKPPVSTPDSTPDSTPTIRLDSFTIKDGTLVYRDVKGKVMERVNDINANIAAASLTGPFDSSGNINIRGLPLAYDVSIGKIIHGRIVPLSLDLKTASGTANTVISGVLVGMDGVPKFKGKIKGKGRSLSQLVRMIAGGGILPGFMASNVELKSEIVASSSFARLSNLSVNLGDTEAVGSLNIKLGKTIDAAAQLAVSHIDLDKWLSLADDKPGPVVKKITRKATYTKGPKGKPRATIRIEPPEDLNTVSSHPKSGVIPANIKASLNLSIKAVTFRKGIVRNLLANAELSSGEITISQLSAQLPGDSDIAVFGFVTADKGEPVFEGELESSVGDLRGVFKWLGAGVLDVPYDRLRKMTLSSKFSATKKQLKINGLDINFDSSRLTGGVTVALRNPPSIGANLTLDRINLDAYLPTAKSAQAGRAEGQKATSGRVGDDLKKSVKRPPQAGKSRPGISMFNVMKSISTSTIAHIKTLVYRGTSIKNIILDGTLNNGRLKLHQASVSRLAGASANISGEINGLGGIAEIKNLKVRAKIGDFSRLARLAGIKTALSGKKLGTIVIDGRIDGPMFKPSLDMKLKAAGGEASVSGSVSFIPLMSGFKGTLAVKHKDAAGLVRAFGVDYRPVGKIGGLDISGSFKGDGSHIDISGIVGRIGKIDVSGAVATNIKGPRPAITAEINTGVIVIDDFISARRKAALQQHRRARLIPATWVVPPDSSISLPILEVAAIKSRWSADPVDLSVIRTFDAAIKLKSTALKYHNYRLDTANMNATVKNGEFNISSLSGNLFGGHLKGKGSLKDGFSPRMELDMSISNMDVGRILKAVSGNGSASGQAGINLRIDTTGQSVADMVSNLGGGGSMALSRLDVKSGGKGTALAGALSLIVGLNKFGGGLGGRKKGNGLADISGTFKIADGVARSSDLKLVSSVGNGQAKGMVDLPKWMIDVSGDVNLSRNILASIISGATGTAAPQLVPFHIRGRLDSPNVKLEIPKVSVGGTGKKGIGGLLNRVIPGILGKHGQQTSPNSTSPQSNGKSKKINPRSILKGLLNSL